MKKTFIALLITGALCSTISTYARAQDPSTALSTLSAMPIASVIVAGYGASMASGAILALPVALSTSGAALIVKSVEASAKGAICVLERASDGARVTIEFASRAGRRTSVAVGEAMAVSVVGAGAMISLAGEVIAFVPNELGRALLHNERVTF